MFTKEYISLIVYDFDGVMTDNKAFVFENGLEAVVINRGDGLGVSMINKLGIRQIILSTETNPVVSTRGKKLNLEVIQGSSDKKHSLMLFCQDNNIALDKVCYVGNDVNDLEAMQCVGFSIAPKDSHFKILQIANKTTIAKGGDGVIREIADLLK